MINILPDEIINEIIKYIKINNDILNLRLVNRYFNKVLKENNNIKKYDNDNDQLVKEITFDHASVLKL